MHDAALNFYCRVIGRPINYFLEKKINTDPQRIYCDRRTKELRFHEDKQKYLKKNINRYKNKGLYMTENGSVR